MIATPYIVDKGQFHSHMKAFNDAGLEDRLKFDTANGDIRSMIAAVEEVDFLHAEQKDKLSSTNAERFFEIKTYRKSPSVRQTYSLCSPGQRTGLPSRGDGVFEFSICRLPPICHKRDKKNSFSTIQPILNYLPNYSVNSELTS